MLPILSEVLPHQKRAKQNNAIGHYIANFLLFVQ